MSSTSSSHDVQSDSSSVGISDLGTDGKSEYQHLAEALIKQGYPNFDTSTLCKVMGVNILPTELQQILDTHILSLKEGEVSLIQDNRKGPAEAKSIDTVLMDNIIETIDTLNEDKDRLIEQEQSQKT